MPRVTFKSSFKVLLGGNVMQGPLELVCLILLPYFCLLFPEWLNFMFHLKKRINRASPRFLTVRTPTVTFDRNMILSFKIKKEKKLNLHQNQCSDTPQRSGFASWLCWCTLASRKKIITKKIGFITRYRTMVYNKQSKMQSVPSPSGIEFPRQK